MAGKQKKAQDGSSNGKGTEFAKGDWIVHIVHGIGEIIRVEKKPIRGEKVSCYRVRTENSVFWIPVGEDMGDRVRPIASARTFKRVLRLLREPGETMANAHKKRRKRIRESTLDGQLRTTAMLIRDLWARKREKPLNDTEMRALQKLTDRFVKEWALSLEIPHEEASQKMHELVVLASGEGM